MVRTFDVLSAYAASAARLAVGLAVGALGPRPGKLLALYEFEGCPFCRKVREALSILDLDAMIFPCPKNGPRFREQVKARGGKAQFPYLVDPNTDSALYESDDIIRHLFENYGAGPVPALLSGGVFHNATAGLASLVRGGRGVYYRKARAPEHPLELYSFEASPYCRIVREVLSSLELPYHLHNVAKGSPGRRTFVERSGKMQVPWLFDPNTNTALFESADIARYLERTYAEST